MGGIRRFFIEFKPFQLVVGKVENFSPYVFLNGANTS